MREEIIIAIIFILLVAIIVLFLFTQTKQSEKRKITLINSKNKSLEVFVEIVNDSISRSRGLMFREPNSLKENEGMLFIFDNEDYHSFWMANTKISLESIFIDAKGKVVDIITMKPCETIADYCKTYKPKEKAKYVLEVNEGFSKRNNLSIGASSLSAT